MSTTKRETILTTAIAALAGTYGVGTRIYRSRVAAFASAEIPALLIEAVNDQATLANIGRLSWNFTFHVMVFTKTGEVDAAADPIIADVHAKILGSTELKNLLVDLEPVSVDWNLSGEPQATPVGVAAVSFRATYQTALDSVT